MKVLCKNSNIKILTLALGVIFLGSSSFNNLKPPEYEVGHRILGPFGQPLCSNNGTCHEQPDIPSPRTVYSIPSKESYRSWWKSVLRLNKDSEEYAIRRRKEEQKMGSLKRRPLIMLGDSITALWTRGNILYSLKDMSTKGNFDPLVLGVSSDMTQHLLYRLQKGGLRPQYADDEDAVFVVMIGTNNMGKGELPGPTAKGILAVTEYLLSNTKGKILLFKVLPRGDGRNVLPTLCPPRCLDANMTKAYTSFLPAIINCNNAVENGLEELLSENQLLRDRITLVDCGSRFESEENEVDESLMPDLVHPNTRGYEILAQCILSNLKESITYSTERFIPASESLKLWAKASVLDSGPSKRL